MRPVTKGTANWGGGVTVGKLGVCTGAREGGGMGDGRVKESG